MRRFAICVPLAIALTLSVVPASADQPVAPTTSARRGLDEPDPNETPEGRNPPPPPSPRMHWYGGETLALDAAAVAVTLAGGQVLHASEFGRLAPHAASVGNGIAIAGGVVYLLGAPVVHGVHGRLKVALADVGVRALAAGVGVALGLGAGGLGGTLAPGGGGWLGAGGDAQLGAVTGGILGCAVGVAFDAIVFANEPARRAPSSPTAVQWVPLVSGTRGGATAGVGATF